MVKTLKNFRNKNNSQEKEPGNSHHETGKEIIISSVEAQEKDNYRYWASLSPEQRLELHNQMITRIYSKELKESRPYNEQPIIFD